MDSFSTGAAGSFADAVKNRSIAVSSLSLVCGELPFKSPVMTEPNTTMPFKATQSSVSDFSVPFALGQRTQARKVLSALVAPQENPENVIFAIQKSCA